MEDLRRSQADTVDVAAAQPASAMGKQKRTLLAALARHTRGALTDPEVQQTNDVWELAVFGLAGRLRFTAICQPWLREAAKRWAGDELPRRRGKGAGSVMRARIASLAQLSRSPPAHRADHGDHPAVLARSDIESFPHRPGLADLDGRVHPRNTAPGSAATSNRSSAGSGRWD